MAGKQQKIQCPYCNLTNLIDPQAHAGLRDGDRLGDENDAFVVQDTGKGSYIYTCPSCHEKFILDENRSYKILDPELKKAILQKIEYSSDWPQHDLLVVVNVYKLV